VHTFSHLYCFLPIPTLSVYLCSVFILDFIWDLCIFVFTLVWYLIPGWGSFWPNWYMSAVSCENNEFLYTYLYAYNGIGRKWALSKPVNSTVSFPYCWLSMMKCFRSTVWLSWSNEARQLAKPFYHPFVLLYVRSSTKIFFSQEVLFCVCLIWVKFDSGRGKWVLQDYMPCGLI